MTIKITGEELHKFRVLLSLLNEQSQPNINALTEAACNIPLAYMNIKMFGYDVARRLVEALPVDRQTEAGRTGKHFFHD